MTYTVTTDLDANTSYRLRGLADRDGQRIAAPVTVALRTGNARPRLSVAGGLQVVPPDGLSVWSRDVAAFTVDCAVLCGDKLSAVLAGGDLPARPRLFTLAARTTWQRTGVDPAEACGQPAGARGVYIATIHADAAGGERVIANATDSAVLVRPGLVWVTSLATGFPVAGARVTLVTPAGVPVHADLTNADGLVKPPALPRVLAIVDKGSDVAVVDPGESGTAWNTGAPPPTPMRRSPPTTSRLRRLPSGLPIEPHVAAPSPGASLAFELVASDRGEPIGDARVEWTLRTRHHAVAFDDFMFGTTADAGEVTADGTGTTDAQGRLSIVTTHPARRRPAGRLRAHRHRA